ncbi:hypothetical protein VPH35_009110 [Triticum aestivum]|uniref:Uncharacterized protein n=2 Tax=Triticum TaxID=4564 RepID=A0A9R0QW26_TRITD|nr:unnamed protein product [Triticum turgidum subsp. durum]
MPPPLCFPLEQRRCLGLTQGTPAARTPPTYTPPSPRACMCTRNLLSSQHSRKETHPPTWTKIRSMGQAVAKAKQEAGRATQKNDKDGKAVANRNDAKEQLIEFMDKNYDKVKPTKTFDEFYHAIFELIEQFCEEQGQLQYRMPSKDKLAEVYKALRKPDGVNLTKGQFHTITENLVTVHSFSFGKAAFDVLVVLFGAPMCALLVKRVVPGLKSFSDDVVIPVATSGAVVYLAKTNKL